MTSYDLLESVTFIAFFLTGAGVLRGMSHLLREGERSTENHLRGIEEWEEIGRIDREIKSLYDAGQYDAALEMTRNLESRYPKAGEIAEDIRGIIAEKTGDGCYNSLGA